METTQQARHTMQPVPKVNGTGKRILVIDDDLAIRVLLHAVLRRMSFEVDLAEDGSVGLERLGNSSYDLVLLDLMMPKVNGYEFLDSLSEIAEEQRPHVVVFTAAGQRGINKIPPDTVCNSILKPFDLEVFLEMISACLEKRH